MGSGAMISKPTGHIIPPVVWKAVVHAAGSSPRHRLMYSKKPPETQVRGIGKGSAGTGPKNGREKYCRSTVEIVTNPPKQKPVSQDSL